MANRGRAVDPQSLINRIWLGYHDTDSRLVKNLIYRLRRKIEPDPRHPKYILTVEGLGYTFPQVNSTIPTVANHTPGDPGPGCDLTEVRILSIVLLRPPRSSNPTAALTFSPGPKSGPAMACLATDRSSLRFP